MKKILFLLPFVLLSCSDESFSDIPEQPSESSSQVEESTGLTTVRLADFAGDPSRVSYPAITRAEAITPEPGTLQLIASIANPSKAEGFNFVKETDGRYMSASSVYYNEKEDKYYVTYHMQGNNYNTTLGNDIAGAIQSFTINENAVNNEEKVILGTGFRASDPKKEDYDFNHLYFDNTDQRIIVVGHNWKVPSTWTSEEEYTGERDNTRAIIGEFNPTTGTLNYKGIDTNEKEYDKTTGKSLGYKDAGDANCVIRANDTPSAVDGVPSGYPNYYVTTRKGIAVLSADAQTLFKPARNEDGSNYFVPTPGSAKFIFDTPRTGSMMDILYLAEETGKGESYEKSSKAKIAQFQVTPGLTGSYVFMKPSSPVTYYNSNDLNILNYEKQEEISEPVSPIDGKNTLYVLEDYEYYAALGTGGMYYTFIGADSKRPYKGVMKFGNRPVNCVVAERPEFESGHDGFIYVANGSKLTILHRRTMEEIVSWNMPSKDEEGNDIESSANYITVRKGPADKDNFTPRERIITVAFGQAGVKIFKFIPTTKTVWEHSDGIQ